ncbi:pseudouridine-5'-phosphate glycosidase [Paraburkholderia hospita]|uniref:Pseudouridine-5'-phosphate glycosidase n=1 Tax=Paraburkholderia hospita TaxID=169430 RepID=A0AAN1JIC1_9BURK|nr:pseudouridine-5'-phosphate glycosidase [Paraburkholderia hospita]AUT73878.1 pseudouridine-5'-phosphate glycosidase [Paraburkholderia hospita]EIM94046.1 indigoidine synthase A [Paraburkholderia hospita]OUL69824.1 pseudouridine-5'-phosphate glycosidase [Paraburkholderia hospita]OUL90031.1 pseudouridine-5'-phosphate glycosidase [Paraburkholderia hospita]SEH47741.1 pseudouridine-5'-phosphate glycosidase [Paraburkholderia hospita]
MDSKLARSWLTFSAPVAAAQAAGRPIVALESTIIAHGMPYPQNVRTAREVEAVIRDLGAQPATIALIGGRIRIGLSDDELELIARSDNVHKVSRRDLPAVLASGGLGATTVAGTMICAALAGIEVFVTGGIGGVHRGAPETFDISADLQELAKTSVAVICAGAKSILDIGLTLEYLETHGVPVLSCEQDNFAAFYARDSGFRADFRLDDAAGQARFIRTKWDLGLAGGVVLSTPVPEAAAMPSEEIDTLTRQALEEAAAQGITGKAVTPFLLARIKALTGGRSLATNIALVKHNAEVGARLALALANAGQAAA